MTTSQAVTAGIAFLVTAVALSVVLGLVFDNVALGIGPAVAIAAGVGAAVHFAGRRRSNGKSSGRR